MLINRFEVLLSLQRCGCTQTFVILDFRVFENGLILDRPLFIFRDGEEGELVPLIIDFDDRSDELFEESGMSIDELGP